MSAKPEARLSRQVKGARLAATVLLVRPSHVPEYPGIEVYVQERVAAMSNYPDTTVFPGGGVDMRDVILDVFNAPQSPWESTSLSWWADAMSMDEEAAQAVVCAAVREVFEETGTLLAVHANGRPVTDATVYQADREKLETHELSFSDFLTKHKLVLRASMLRPFARFISPDDNGRLFDLSSFVAIVPPGQEPACVSTEASSTGFFPPQLIIDGWRAGLLRLALPTWAQLESLARAHSIEELMMLLEDHIVYPVVGDPARMPEFADYHRQKSTIIKERFKPLGPKRNKEE